MVFSSHLLDEGVSNYGPRAQWQELLEGAVLCQVPLSDPDVLAVDSGVRVVQCHHKWMSYGVSPHH